ncbi:MAG: cysteine-rich CWC family protein [Betaproteobacteria bacterium]
MSETVCSRCHATFHCGIEDQAPCWCATDYPLVLSGDGIDSCMCPNCLSQTISEQTNL